MILIGITDSVQSLRKSARFEQAGNKEPTPTRIIVVNRRRKHVLYARAYENDRANHRPESILGNGSICGYSWVPLSPHNVVGENTTNCHARQKNDRKEYEYPRMEGINRTESVGYQLFHVAFRLLWPARWRFLLLKRLPDRCCHGPCSFSRSATASPATAGSMSVMIP
jgi:hypothetical protein